MDFGGMNRLSGIPKSYATNLLVLYNCAVRSGDSRVRRLLRGGHHVVDPVLARRLDRDRLIDVPVAREALEDADPFDVERVEVALRGVVERLGVKPKDVFQPVRVAITGTTVSPGIFESVAVLGREETLRRLDAALGAIPGAA
ncbi:MAG TPA: hypothetical protein VI217_21655 [Mycobacterium sp.]